MVVNGGDNRRLQAGEIVGGRDGGRRRFGGGGRLGKQAVDGEGHSPDGKDEQQQKRQHKAHAENIRVKPSPNRMALSVIYTSQIGAR